MCVFVLLMLFLFHDVFCLCCFLFGCVVVVLCCAHVGRVSVSVYALCCVGCLYCLFMINIIIWSCVFRVLCFVVVVVVCVCVLFVCVCSVVCCVCIVVVIVCVFGFCVCCMMRCVIVLYHY